MSKILIIGAGWYGCHLAFRLSQLGHHVRLLEKNTEIFTGASFYNQNRLHLGFHYPRSSLTRAQSKRGCRLFKIHYPTLISPIDLNIYAIPQSESFMDFKTYCDIMTASGLDWDDVTDCLPVSLTNIEGALACDEFVIQRNKAKEYFQLQLKDVISLDYSISEKECISLSADYDLVLDCTWNHLFNSVQFIYEPCIVFVYRHSLHVKLALTLMDGSLFSLFPLDGNLYTLTHVKYTPLGKYPDSISALKRIEELNHAEIDQLKSCTENHVCSFYPSFHSSFEYVGYYTSIKTKQVNALNDARNTFISNVSGNIYAIHSGKIDTIFDIEHQIVRLLRD